MLDKTYFLKSNPALYSATLSEFSMKPFQFASLNEIIKSSNFNKGSFYYRFEDKFDLYQALLSDVIVKQFDYIERLNSFSINQGNLKSYIAVLFQSQYDLYHENKLYIDLLKYFGNETDDFRKNIQSIIGNTVIDVFCDSLLKYLSEVFISSDKKQIFINQLKFAYYNLPTILDFSFTKESVDSLIDNLLDGISFKSKPEKPELFISATNLKYLYSKSNFEINNISLSINKSEIFSIVGPSKSGKTTIMKLLNGRINQSDMPGIVVNFDKSNEYFDDFKLFSQKYNLKRSISWNVSIFHHSDMTNLQNNNLFDQFGINPNLKKRIGRFNAKQQKIIELVMQSIFSTEIMIIDDLFENFTLLESRLITNYLLKCRSEGSTIILTSAHIENVISFSDKIAFLTNGRLINIKTVDELHQKYGKITHIIEYIDGYNTKIAAFSNENFNSEFFKLIIDHYKIISMKTKTILPDEIFKLETGVNL
jgi:ABC-type multidrug transport system ATPase subunit/AcrR family transcriptional regulator